MQSLNFKPIIGLDETIKYGRYFQNQIRHRFVAENYQDGAFLYSLTDKTNKGLRYFLSVSKEIIEHLTAYQSISFIANKGEEISNHLFVNKLIDQNYDRSYSFSPVKTKNFTLENLEKRNMILTNILQNNTWIDSAQLSFHLEQVNFTFVSQNASASIILMRGENPFYVDKNDLTLQQLFIANNIKESTFHSLERDLRNLYQEMTNETELFIFLYNKDEGLLNFLFFL